MASATVVQSFGQAAGSPTLTPPANAGCAVLVPEPSPPNYSSYYRVLAFLGADSSPTTTTIAVPASKVAGRDSLRVDLPTGVSTPLAEIGAGIFQYLEGLTPPLPPNAPTGFGPIPATYGFGTQRAIVNGAVSSPYTLTPPAGGALGSAVLVPVSADGSNYAAFYMILAYLDATAGNTALTLPAVDGILVLDLPNGIYTSTSEIAAIIDNNGGGGPPTGADGTMPPTSP
ncbi:MAG TPA: hypothetical protein VGG39_00150 [Polyangiaceae bacterium]|jgi:hypothetical protein